MDSNSEDTIKRFGGSTAPTAPWPKEANDDVEEDKLPLGRMLCSHSLQLHRLR